ncbi:hypothetical protein HPB50_027893 [Hyalomma asiaticum]|nr:hypothetical protein HPB50_027893 [Hyalomma asiaticum]
MNCCAHVLNTVLRNAFDDRYLAQELPDLLEQLQKVKAVVTFLKQSGLTSQLPHGVCQEICTRWNSKLAMIKSVLSQYDAIENLLDSRGNLLLEDVNKTLLTEVAEFLEPFKEASEKLEQDKVVTLPLVLMYYTKLKKHLTADSTDSPEVCQLKSRTLEFLQIKLPIEELHKVATFLWPPFRHLRVLDEQERKGVHDRVRELLIDVHLRLPQGETSTDHPDYEPPAKRTSLDEFKEWRDAAETQPADSGSGYPALATDPGLRQSSTSHSGSQVSVGTQVQLQDLVSALQPSQRELGGTQRAPSTRGQKASTSAGISQRSAEAVQTSLTVLKGRLPTKKPTPPLTTSSEEHSSGADSMEVCAADTEETGELAASGKPPKSPVTAPNPLGRGKGARHPVVAPGKGT